MSFFDKVGELFSGEKHDESEHQAQQAAHSEDSQTTVKNRYQSFAPQTSGQVKWHVDGCSYFWALSEAIEEAQESIWILDWWLTPELYLRRPPAKNNRYRLDNLLVAAAERGVKIKIIVYKEVEQALTLNSEHTKTHLEGLHPNILVFRHPDHHPTGIDISSEIKEGFANLKLGSFSLSNAADDTVKTLYGTSDDVVLFWAHHEKLCAIDGKIAFMGGLDACFGRWDTNSHPIADAHPGNVDAIIFPGQDYNNARVYDFADVDKWEQNKLDRTRSSRMGWSDISISLSGPIVNSLMFHFKDRWNYIFIQKYNSDDDGKDKYSLIEDPIEHLPVAPEMSQGQQQQESGYTFGGLQHQFNNYFGAGGNEGSSEQADIGAHIQLTRSCTDWSAGRETEHSIANAYIHAISNAQHFVYIENQFFITATGDEQKPVANQIGKAIVERILRAHEGNEDFKVIVLMPAVPAFAGDLQSDGALGTRAIMEFQYNSINRGGHSIMEKLTQGGVQDVSKYISFYNLRNYDRINTSATMQRAQEESGVDYEDARREFDDTVEAGADGYERNQDTEGRLGSQYNRYQEAAGRQPDKTWDTISACYMQEGPDLNSIQWEGTTDEIDAFVSEELYIHSKVLIADDRLVICGSANLNDRSQLGNHDSEIAVIIEDPTPLQSSMNGQPFTASKFAASLRRQLFRKHLGLLPNQVCDRPDANFHPVTRGPNEYDWDSTADILVQDPMSNEFDELWRGVARTNTEIFSKVFHNVPNDEVRTWEAYEEFFSKKFIIPGSAKEDEDEDEKEKRLQEEAGKVEYGHVVKDEFPGGVDEVKELLARVRGTLVEMPLNFLIDVDDMAKKGLSFNAITDDLYT